MVLAEVEEPIVIFVDEIDTTLSLDFTDDFYAAIRYLYVARSTDAVFRRLSFVLIGVATPADLIRDPKRTPFNIGQRVDLTDFTEAEALPLAAGLGLPDELAQRALHWIWVWTGGHPYLTQRLCRALVDEQPDHWSEDVVEQTVARVFLGPMSEQDNNLQFVRDMMTKRAPNIFEVLTTYQAVLRSRPPVIDEEQSIFKSHLKLSGVVKRDGKILKIRNAIYRVVFDDRWIKSHFPINWAKRLQRAAIVLIGLVLFSSVPLSAFGWWQYGQARLEAAEAERQRLEAENQRRIAEQTAAEAERQRVIAEDAREDADGQRVIAQQQRQIAEQLRQKAENARGTAEQRRQQAETSRQEAEQQRTIAEEQSQIATQQRVIAEEQSQIATQQRDIANEAKDEADKAKLAQSLSAQALALRDTFSQRSLLLAIESLKLDILEETDAGALLHRLLGEIGGIPLIGHEEPVLTVAFTPDGKWLATGSQDGTVQLWNKSAPDLPPHDIAGQNWRNEDDRSQPRWQMVSSDR